MFTNFIKQEWAGNVDESIEEQSSNDFVYEDLLNYDEISNDFPHHIDSSTPEPMMSVPLIDLLSDPSIYKNFTKYFKTILYEPHGDNE